MQTKIYALIVASGTGNRFSAKLPKQFIKILGKSPLERSVAIFNNNKAITDIIVVTHPSYLNYTKKILSNYQKARYIIKGGVTRQHSVRNGLMSIIESDSLVLIHDAVRPFVSDRIINECIKWLEKFNAVVTAVPVSDTVYKVSEHQTVTGITDRKSIYLAQTPQGFKTSLITKSHDMASHNNDYCYTDDASLFMKYYQEDIHIIEGDVNNIKITFPGDIQTARLIARSFKENN